jgi:hypothetical protein
VGYVLQHPRTASLSEDLGAGTSQRSHLEIYSCFLNVEHLKRDESTSFLGLPIQHTFFKKLSFFRSFLDWVVY